VNVGLDIYLSASVQNSNQHSRRPCSYTAGSWTQNPTRALTFDRVWQSRSVGNWGGFIPFHFVLGYRILYIHMWHVSSITC